MPKNIVLFIDGTWNKAIDGEDGETNVHKLCTAAATNAGPSSLTAGVPVARPGSRQVVHYLEGVGTGAIFDRTGGGITGFGTAHRIREAYLFLALNYEAGDSVYLFGFSRGAFAVRALAGFVGLVGLLFREEASWIDVEKAYKLYEKKIRGDSSYMSALVQRLKIDEGRAAEVQPIPIHFIGVWDTVRKLGAQVGSMDLTRRWTGHHDHTDVPEHITHVRHALALHELRPEFEPTLWEGTTLPGQSLQQVWFAGAHSDVGGGYRATELSNVALNWMAREASAHGLDLPNGWPIVFPPSDTVHYATLIRRPSPRQVLADCCSLPGRRLIQSFFLHESACRPLLSATPRTYRFSTFWSAVKKIMRLFDGSYENILVKVDQLTVALHLELSAAYNKRFVR
jgi:uncharacterized protein (DUF2235 family)